MRTVRSSSHVYPSMHWALCIPACTGQGGVSQHALDRGMSAQGEGGVCPGGALRHTSPQHALGTVYPSMHWAGVSAQGEVSAQGGVCPGGVYPGVHWGRYPPAPWTEWQAGVKHNLRKLRLRTVTSKQISVIFHNRHFKLIGLMWWMWSSDLLFWPWPSLTLTLSHNTTVQLREKKTTTSVQKAKIIWWHCEEFYISSLEKQLHEHRHILMMNEIFNRTCIGSIAYHRVLKLETTENVLLSVSWSFTYTCTLGLTNTER